MATIGPAITLTDFMHSCLQVNENTALLPESTVTADSLYTQVQRDPDSIIETPDVQVKFENRYKLKMLIFVE